MQIKKVVFVPLFLFFGCALNFEDNSKSYESMKYYADMSFDYIGVLPYSRSPIFIHKVETSDKEVWLEYHIVWSDLYYNRKYYATVKGIYGGLNAGDSGLYIMNNDGTFQKVTEEMKIKFPKPLRRHPLVVNN